SAPAAAFKSGATCAEGNSQIMILGTYHMSNPGLDSVNLQADDVLSEKRQSEISDLLQRLAKFNPTKIAIEAPYGDRNQPARYKNYLAGQYKLGRNEIEQIGFQLAKMLNHTTIYPVDFPMFMDGTTPNEIEDPKPKPASSTEQPKTPQKLSREDKLLRQSTVVEYLRHLNDPREIDRNHAQYMTMLLPDDNPEIYARANLVTNWYKRNLRIFTNINRINEPGKDRILVLIGSGHLKILRDLAAGSPYFCLIDVNEYLQ